MGTDEKVVNDPGKAEREKLEERLRSIETSCAARIATLESVKDHEARIREIEKLTPALRAALWALTALAGSAMVFIWSLITNQVHLVMP